MIYYTKQNPSIIQRIGNVFANIFLLVICVFAPIVVMYEIIKTKTFKNKFITGKEGPFA